MTTFDFIILGLLFLCFIIGCIRGFISQLYDIIALIGAFLLSIVLNHYVSNYISIFPFSKNTKIYTMIFDKADTYIAFIVCFILIYIILKVLGIIVKPLLKHSINLLNITSFINKFFGGFISLFKGIIFIYLLILIMMLPMFNTKTYCDQSIICKYIKEYVPYTKEYIEDLETFSLIHLSDDEELLNTMINAYKLGVIDDERFIEIYEDNILHNEDSSIQYQLTQSDYDLTVNLLRQKYALPAIKSSMNQIEVIDE